jgi:hypothetical protein
MQAVRRENNPEVARIGHLHTLSQLQQASAIQFEGEPLIVTLPGSKRGVATVAGSVIRIQRSAYEPVLGLRLRRLKDRKGRNTKIMPALVSAITPDLEAQVRSLLRTEFATIVLAVVICVFALSALAG